MLLEISDPSHPRWGQQLTLEEVNALTSDVHAARTVVSWLLGEGVSRDKIVVTPNHGFVHVTLTGAEAEELLETEFYHFHHPHAQGRSHIQAESFSVPTHIDAVCDFVTASSVYPNMHPRASKRSLGLVSGWPADAPFPPPGFVVPQVIWRVYGIANPNVANQASTQSVFENLAQSYAPSDLTAFQNAFKLAVNPIANLIGPNNASDCFVNSDDCGEAELDVEYIMGVAQNSPTWFWSISDDDPYPFLDWLIALSSTPNAPYVHSVSYGDIETDSPYSVMMRFNSEAMLLGLRGISVIVASGDDGVANFIARQNASACGFNPSYPASAPYVTTVGATQGPEMNQTEIACTSVTNGGITTGGGFSGVYPQPSYQAQAVATYLATGPNLPPTNLFNTSGRAYPDVSVMGHSYITVGGGNFQGADGTSASAPVFAAMITLINAERMKQNKKPLGFLNQIIYQLAASTPAAFNDITSGTNNCCAAGDDGQPICCQYGFTAAKGFDPLTGWGSPHFPVFSRRLIALR